MNNKFFLALIAAALFLIPARADAAAASCPYLLQRNTPNCLYPFGNMPGASLPTPAPFSYSSSWMANTYSAINGYWMPTYLDTISVASDGTTFLYEYYDEGGHELASFKNGVGLNGSTDLHGFGRNGTSALAFDGTYLYAAITQKFINNNTNAGGKRQYPASGSIWNAIRRYNTTIGNAIATTTGANGGYGSNQDLEVLDTVPSASIDGNQIVGLAVSGGKLYVSDAYQQAVLIIDLSTWNVLATVPVTNPGKVIADASGNFWVVTGQTVSTSSFSWRFSGGYQLLAFNSSGTAVPAGNITLPSNSVVAGMCFDPSNNLVLGDQGPDFNFKVWSNPLTAPSQTSTIGYTGGIFNGATSAVGPMRFSMPNGCGFDGSNNFYAGGGPYLDGSQIDSYNGVGLGATRNWTASSQVYYSVADVTSDNKAFNQYEKYNYNTNAPAGTEATWTFETLNPFTQPLDPRMNNQTGANAVRRLSNGFTYVYIQDQLGVTLGIYKLSSSQLLTLSGLFNRASYRGSYPAGNPGSPYEWHWTDSAGTGIDDFAAGTYETLVSRTSLPLSHTTTNQEFQVDDDGNIYHPWTASMSNTSSDIGGYIEEYPLQGFDAFNNPLYTTSSAILTALPAATPIRVLYHMSYDKTYDTMMVVGYPVNPLQNPTIRPSVQNSCAWDGSAYTIGMNMAAIKNWSTSPTLAWSVGMPTNCTSTGRTVKGVTTAGKYVFAAQWVSPASNVYMYDITNGSLLQTITPTSPIFSGTSDLDMSNPLVVHQIDASHYDMFVEDDLYNKTQIYHISTP